MDRLSTVALLSMLVAACGERAAPGPPVERVNAVRADPPRPARPEDFCDVVATGDKARPFGYPKLTGAAPAAGGRWRWVNAWATWCLPCVEEIPMLVEWQAQMEKSGTPFDLVLVSLDTDDATVDRFRKQHPRTPPSLRIDDPDRAEDWVVSLGLDRGATLPIHVLVDPHGGIRCARTGGVGRSDQAVVRRILAGR
jgi:thiol-disulfide isomerase/thioredoxin